jgi:hypothetical protein
MGRSDTGREVRLPLDREELLGRVCSMIRDLGLDDSESQWAAMILDTDF